MPHVCTNCGRSFPDGSKEMLSGCPECGGNKFQYLHEKTGSEATADETAEGPDRPESDGSVSKKVSRAATTVRDYVARQRSESQSFDEESVEGEMDTPEPPSADETDVDEDETEDVKDVSTDDELTGEFTPATADLDEGAEITDSSTSDEDTAQASARSAMADEFTLADTDSESPMTERSQASGGESEEPPSDGRVVREPVSEKPSDIDSLRAELQDQFESIRILEPGQYELNLMELYDRNVQIIALQEDGKYVIDVPEKWSQESEDESD